MPTILVVEDEAMVRNLIVNVLVHYGYRVLEADSAAEALMVSATLVGPIDLLIADHTLRMMTGREVAEEIRKSRRDMKVLHISGYPQKQLKEEGGLLADAGYLAKPFRADVLAEAVKKILAAEIAGHA